MFRVQQICGAVLLSSVGVIMLSGVPDASAQKKMTYEDAYRQCKSELDRTFPSGSQSTTGRNTAGVACMQRLGFRAKKSADF